MKKNFKDLIKKLPSEVLLIFKIFQNDIRLVGGSVRDLLLNKKINDYDFASPLLPSEIIERLKIHNLKAIPTGLKYGTITAIINGKNFQITTLRSDFNHQGRDCEVIYTNKYEVDASRRDFTINALYLDHHGKIYDYFNGINHLKKNEVIFINNANDRINEDYLRIMRFFRFSCYYANKFDKDGLEASINNINKLQSISKERIRDEFLKIIYYQKHQHVFKILKIFKKTNLDFILWSNKINILSFKRTIKFIKYIDEKNLKFALFSSLFIDKELNLESLNKNLVLTKIERKFINNLQRLFLEFDVKKLSIKEINYLLTQYSKNFITIFYILTKNQKKNINSQKIIKNINYIQNLKIPEFPIEIQDLIKINNSINLPNYKVNNLIRILKKHWANHNFKITKKNLIKYFLNNYQNFNQFKEIK